MEKVRDFASLQSYLRSNQIFDRYGLDQIGVFGSLSRDEAFHDIDLMIDTPIPFEALINLQAQLESDLNTPVDILIKTLAEPIILHRAMKDMRYATKS
ncbi:nucleotidyltransferase family protein [Parapedobacter deserti]|uniref:Nucleotidyltransferase family protein n=1 Tax=Parapedobacter deserti TaxID=1912957 RepID=A0ABV7JGX6_9SPHI